MKKNFRIKYKLFKKDGTLLKEGEFKVKNQLSELNAKVNFGEYIMKKYPNAFRLELECKNEVTLNQTFSDSIMKFKDIFGTSF